MATQWAPSTFSIFHIFGSPFGARSGTPWGRAVRPGPLGRRPESGDLVEDVLRLKLLLEAVVRVQDAARVRGDGLSHVPRGARRTALLLLTLLEDGLRLRQREVAGLQEGDRALLVVRDLRRLGELHAGDELVGRAVRVGGQRGDRLTEPAVGRRPVVDDADLLEVLHAPEVPVHADAAEEERRDL